MRNFEPGLEGPHPDRRGRRRGDERRRGEEGFGGRGRHGHHIHGGFGLPADRRSPRPSVRTSASAARAAVVADAAGPDAATCARRSSRC